MNVGLVYKEKLKNICMVMGDNEWDKQNE